MQLTVDPSARFYLKASWNAHIVGMQTTGLQVHKQFRARKTGTNGIIGSSGNILVIAFAGTNEPLDWLETNSRVMQVPYPTMDPNSPIRVHQGFIGAYLSVRSAIHDYWKEKGHQYHQVVCCGYSLGGALATLCLLDLQFNFLDINPPQSGIRLFTYGCPKVGNRAFVESFHRHIDMQYCYRFVYGWDVVPNLLGWPAALGGYDHIGRHIQIGSRAKPWGIVTESIAHHQLESYLLGLS